MDNTQLIKDLLQALKVELIRFRALAAFLFAIVLLVGVAVAINWPKYYVSSALIVRDVTNVIQPLMKGAAEIADVNTNMNIEEVLTSRRMLEGIHAKLNPDAEALSPRELEEEIYRIRSNIIVKQVPGSRDTQHRVFYQAASAEEAYNTLSAIVEVFIFDTVEAKKRESNNAYKFISEQVENYKRRLEKADQKLKEFKSRSIDATEGGVQKRIAELKAEIQGLRLSINESEERIRTTRGQLKDEQQYLSVRTRLQDLEARKTLLTDQLDQLLLVYQDSYPDIVTIKKQIAEIDMQLYDITAGQNWRGSNNSELPLFEELRKQLSAAELELITQKRRLGSLQELLENEYARAEEVASNQAELADLMRDYEVTQTHYEQMLSRKESSILTMALNEEGQGASFRVIEPPYFPLEPAGFRALYIYFASPLLALGAPIGLVVLYILLDPRQRSYQMLKQRLPEGVELIANVPHRGTPLGQRLLRKDMIMLTFVGLTLAGAYIYGFIEYQAVL